MKECIKTASHHAGAVGDESVTLNSEIIELLRKEGCSISGFADIRCLSKEVRQNFDRAAVIALPHTKEALIENNNGSPQRYYKEWLSINARLQELALMTADLLIERGYKACAKISSAAVQDEDLRTVLPHKTAATLAGIGWIGKCAALVTEEAGSALRLIAVLTNAPLECGTPVREPKCGPGCTACADMCPGKAVAGRLWEPYIDRDALLDVRACRSAAGARAESMLGVHETICGLCISNCPFTKRAFDYP